jgi:site-specific recombinase XerD
MIYCRIHCNKQRKNFSTGLFTTQLTWCKKTEKIKGREPVAIEINEKLARIKQSVIKCYFDTKASKKQLTVDLIQTEVFPGSNKAFVTIEENNATEVKTIAKRYLDDLTEKLNADIIRIGTFKSYRSAIVKFLSYVKMYYGSEKTCLESIDKQFIFNFENHLLINCKFGPNYTHKVLRNTVKLFYFAYDLGFLETKITFKFRVRYTNPHRAILNINEVKSIIDLELNNIYIEEARDCFIFQCYTGLAYSELKGLRLSNIKRIDNEKWIVINRLKTGSESKLILLPIAESILDKYKNHPYCITKNQLLPVRDNSLYNKRLNRVQVAANLSTKLSSHIGRHIFATTIALQFGLPIETLAKVLGHTNLSTTMIYGKILDNKIKNDFDILRKNLM